MNTKNLPNDNEKVRIHFNKGGQAIATWVPKKPGDGLLNDVLGKFHYDFKGIVLTCTIYKEDTNSGIKEWSMIEN